MAIKYIVSEDEFGKLSKEIQTLYIKKGDVYQLDAEGNPSDEKIKEFRQNNIELMKKITAAEEKIKKFEGVDPEKARNAIAELETLKEKKLVEEGKIEELLNQRTERMKADFQNQTKILTDKVKDYELKLTDMRNQLAESIIDKEIQLRVSSTANPQKGAMPDIISRGRKIFKIDDKGQVVAVDEKGNTRFGKDGISSLSIEEWAVNLPVEAPFLFEPAKGIQSPGSTPGVINQGGKKILITRDPVELGKHASEIAKEEISVQSPE